MKDIFLQQNPWRDQENYQFSFFKRNTLEEIIKNIDNDKIIGLVGSRQVGKSSLLFLTIDHLLRQKISSEDIFYFNLDNFKLQEIFTNSTQLIEFTKANEGNRKYIFIDEIQRLSNPGLILKEIYDLKLNIKIFYSGSVNIAIKLKLTEHLIGREKIFEIQRLSFNEYFALKRLTTKENALEEFLIYGSYPEVAKTSDLQEKKLILRDIYQTYVQKDLTVGPSKISDHTAFNKLLILLASQTGCLISLDSLSKSLRIKRAEIEKYLSILEDTFIIKLIYPFYKNYKKEITKTPKIFFLDLGMRNFLLKDFQEMQLRADNGEIFENFYLLELLNNDIYRLNTINFWRTTNQTEIDFIVASENQLDAIEVKYNKSAPPKSFKTIKEYYPEINTKLISRNDFL